MFSDAPWGAELRIWDGWAETISAKNMLAEWIPWLLPGGITWAGLGSAIWTLLSLETYRRERGRWDFLKEPRLELTIVGGVQVSGKGRGLPRQVVGKTLVGPQVRAGTWDGHTEDGRGPVWGSGEAIIVTACLSGFEGPPRAQAESCNLHKSSFTLSV